MKALAILLACCVLLAGCSDNKKKDDEPETSSSSSSSSTGSAPTGNGTIEVLVNRTTPNGAVPFAVNFTLDAVFRSAAGAIVPTPATARWEVLIFTTNGTANGTAHEDSFTDAPNGTALPANVTYNLTVPGNLTFNTRVHAPGFATGNASFLVLANATGAAGGGVLFFEGAEADESQWDLEDEYVLDLIAERVPTGESHPLGGWGITDAEAHTGAGSWHAPYPDNYEARMTSVPFPAGASTLTFWLKGGAEDNGNDGLHVLAGAAADDLEEVHYQAVVLADWTQFVVDVPADATVIQFLMYGDASCSSDPAPVGGGDGVVCGAGWDAGGFYLDDITVA
jgi:hypothetical protein